MKLREINEFYRKAIHILNIVIPLIHIFFIKERMDMIVFLTAILIFCFFIEINRNKNLFLFKFFKKYFFFMMRESEKEGEITGSTWVFVGSLFTIILVPKPFCLLGLFFLAVGDTFAALFGASLPYIKVGNKTLSGSFACFLSCSLIGLLFNFEIIPTVILFGAFIATLTELLSTKINDNVSIPVFSGLSMYYVNIMI
tara:strand:- start:1061 stop:1654 length:594 start_codon:yes stop_codon:yes gene_type:complete